MLILLPPSETKRLGGQTAAMSLRHDTALAEARRSVRKALVALSADEEAAAAALRLGVKNRAESALNLELDHAPVLPAIERYTGVLYDALDVDELDTSATEWIGQHVMIQSALFGLIGATDTIPAYRLSASTRLPALGTGLKQLWRRAHGRLSWPQDTLILDLRSRAYADLAPVPGAMTLQVAQRGPDGELRALNHFNKAAKGDLVKRLALSDAQITTVAEFRSWAEQAGLDVRLNAQDQELTLVTDLGAPAPVPAR